MKKMKILMLMAAAVCSLLVFNDQSQAQVPPGRWWHLPGIVSKIGITDMEGRQLDSMFVQNRLRLIDLKSGVEKEQFELQNLLDAAHLDEKAAQDQFSKLQTARSKLNAERFSFLLEVRKLLGRDRFQQLEGLMKDFRKNATRKFRQGQRPLQNKESE